MLDAGREKLVQAYVQGIVEPRCRKDKRIGSAVGFKSSGC